MPGRDVQRIGIDIQANGSRHAHHERRQCQHARSRANVEDAVGNRDGQGLLESFDAQGCGWMMSGSKGIGIGQSERAGWTSDFRRRDQNTPDTNGARTQQPDRSVIPCDGCRHGYTGHTQGASHNAGRHAIRDNGRNPVVNRLDIERAQLHKLVKRIMRWTSDVDAIGHPAA